LPLPFAGNPIGTPFIELQSVDSTNKYAMQLVQAEHLPNGQAPQHGAVFFTLKQTSGKGQRGKNWISEPGANLTMSVILNPYPLKLTEQFILSACVALSVHQFFSKYAGDDTRIKWPNDIYWRDRKAGGILIESVVSSRQAGDNNWKWAIAGIGININQTAFPAELPNPVSLKQITGKNFNLTDLAKDLCSVLEKNYQLAISGGSGIILSQYQTHLYKKDQLVKLKKGSRVFETTIRGVSTNGRLITENAIEELFDFGEVQWLTK
jgi:BirA family biotin operon repressor/biotin-[acetyl-CoA-carboxylase] ligase